MKYVGIDPSLTATAIVILDAEAEIEFKAIIKSKLRGVDRLLEIETEVQNSLLNTSLSHICIEGYSFGSRVGQAFSIGELGGILKRLLTVKQKLYTVIQPTSLKKFVTGKGNCPKDLILKEVYKKWSVDLNDNNLADAYGLARIAYGAYHKEELLKYEMEVIEKACL